MPLVDKTQIEQARKMDLLTYLKAYEPDELVHFSSGTYMTRTHDSLKISNGKWYWWSRGIGGYNALDYLIKVRGLEFAEAVETIVGHRDHEFVVRQAMARSVEIEKPIEFQLPPRHADNRRVFAYLRSRGIDPEVLNHCFKTGQLYEDGKHHNCVFVGMEGEKPMYGALRGTLSKSTFVGEVPGSDKRFSFAVPVRAGPHPTLCVFECAIDALSYLTLLKQLEKDWRRANVLSLGGIYSGGNKADKTMPKALEQYLKDNTGIKKVVLCLDADERGREAAAYISELLDGYEVLDNPPQNGKDYNDCLQIKMGLYGKVATRGHGR